MRRRTPRADRPPLPAGFGVIWSTVAIDLVGFGIILPVLPQYAERYGASPATIGVLFASFSVAQLVFAPVWGAVSDRVGRKPVLIVSLAGTAVGSLVTGLAGSLPLLFAGRLLDGASGASVSVAQASAADLAGPGERARLFGLLGAAFGFGFVAGPALGALASLADPRLPFFVAAALAGANALIAVRRLPETNRRHVRAMGRPNVVLADGIGAEGIGGLDPGAAVADPVGGPGQVRVTLVRLVVVAFGSLVAFSAFEATFALFGERRLSFSPASTGVVFTVIGLVLVAVEGGLVRPTVRRLGETATLRLALVVNAVGLLLLSAVHSWWLLVPALAALVVGQGLAMPSLTAATATVAPEHRRGGALGIQQSAGGLARVLGPLLGGLAFEHVGLPAPYIAGAAVMLLCAVILT
ncbi:MAG: MFS transporter [Acidimicrobiales bacterium]